MDASIDPLSFLKVESEAFEIIYDPDIDGHFWMGSCWGASSWAICLTRTGWLWRDR